MNEKLVTVSVDNATLHFFDLLQSARAAGKGWWCDLQIRQIEESLWKDKKIKALTHALEMVRDADNDCKADGGHPLPIPDIARAAIDRALDLAVIGADPAGISFAAPSTAGRA